MTDDYTPNLSDWRELLAQAADARRKGDHALAGILETDAAINRGLLIAALQGARGGQA